MKDMFKVLAGAIVLQAVDDYRDALKIVAKYKKYENMYVFKLENSTKWSYRKIRYNRALRELVRIPEFSGQIILVD